MRKLNKQLGGPGFFRIGGQNVFGLDVPRRLSMVLK